MAMLLVAAGAGLREGELWGLTRDRVNWFKRTIAVNRQIVQVKPADVKPWHEHVHGDLYFGPPKTPASVRTLPVEPAIIDVLARHMAKYPVGIKDLIFTTADGLPIRRNRFHEKPWATAKRVANLEREQLVLHDLRHFYASLLIYQGLNVKQVQKRMGHKSATETLDTYAAVFDAADDLTREAAIGMLVRIVGALDTELTGPPAASDDV
jgi:integrase